MQILDGLRNLVSNMGTGRDKAGQAEYITTHTEAQCMAAYENSTLIQRAVDTPAEDAVREWRSWQAEADQISRIEAEESRLDVRGKVLEAQRLARMTKGAAILIGTGDEDPTQPIALDRVGAGGLKYLTVLSSQDLAAGEVEENALAPGYGLPKWWDLTAGNAGAQRIDPSRLAMFHGVTPLADRNTRATLEGWGVPSINGMISRLIAVDEVAGNVLSLVYEGKVDVIKIPGLMQNLQSRGQEFEAEVLRRLTLASTAKGINASLILDGEEEYQQKSASFSGLPDVMDRMMQLACAASGMPMTLLFGTSPGGLNATGENDVRNYYDRVKVRQETRMRPAMHVLDECMIRSALGDRPKEIHYEWSPLWQPTQKEVADTGKVIADTFKVIDDMGDIPPEVVATALVNALTEAGAAPGLESGSKEFYSEGGEDDE